MDRLVAKDSRVQAEFTAKELDTTNFAKKLLGQIVFLYFLQKKGWLGVREGATWGAGPKDFLHQLFDRQWMTYDNFFNDILEPLFYEALAIERHDNYYDQLNARIPFLNGGLFEPMGNYDWKSTDILIDNDVFADIFDTFDLYNFTVREDEPLEKEVAVDPEMLGKVFENLLEVTDRKSKGAFYTPREIVHYMCQESLINYLSTAMGDAVPRDDLANFIHVGELAVQNDTAKEAGTVSYTYQMPELIRTHAKKLDDALSSIKICDPAIGSGAFPVGMMQEIIKAREVLTTYLGSSEDRTTYHFKRQAIQESIYGVDIDPGAIDIAKLRLWLSLVVDEDDYHHIKPLPNLDYKIVCGNSLSAVEKDLFNLHLFQELEQLKNVFFDETNPDKKRVIKRTIDEKIKQLTNDNDDFDFEIYFSEIFRASNKLEKGFDVVIGNPPYVRQERIKEYKEDFRSLFPDVYAGTADLYVYFFAQGLRILRENGVLTFISPNKFLRAGYGENLRTYLSRQTSLEALIDFGDVQVFDATTYPFISVIRKHLPNENASLQIFEVKDKTEISNLHLHMAQAETMPQSALKPRGWQLRDSQTYTLLQRLEINQKLSEYVENTAYRGLTTGLNKAFEIDGQQSRRIIEQYPGSSELIKPWLRGKNVNRWRIEWDDLYVIAVQNSGDADANNWWANAKDEKEAEQKFSETYPGIHEHLLEFEEDLRKRSDQGRFWWELRACAYYSEFSKPKIIWAKYGIEPAFAYDRDGYYGGNTVFILPTEDLALVGILNSRVTQWYAQNTFNIVRGGYIEWIPTNVANLPIPNMDQDQKVVLTRLVRELIQPDKERSEVNRLEREVDRLVYSLFNLNDGEVDEIAMIERDLQIDDNLKTADFFDTLWKITGDTE